MPIKWTDDALDAGISQLKALRFSTGMSLREQMSQVLHAAWNAQERAQEDERAEHLKKQSKLINKLHCDTLARLAGKDG